MNYKYYICDVFTNRRFGGNQLAVIPDAKDLTDDQMQQIAREFNFSESTFILPPQKGQTQEVRIFTPSQEIPFAGHPNIGTAFVLATINELTKGNNHIKVVFEEKAGFVPVTIREDKDGNLWCELKAPETLFLGKTVSIETFAAALSLSVDDIIVETHEPQVASVGLPFLIGELKDQSALERATINYEVLRAIKAIGASTDIHIYTHSNDEFDIRARMFAPFDGIHEDPATGSANCALCSMLSQYKKEKTGKFKWKIGQGIEMGRPSLLEARTEKKDDEVIGVWIGGSSVLVSEGIIFID
jgi:trans-2,3-dihydro-3-hydroxyanthranilate isomerase